MLLIVLSIWATSTYHTAVSAVLLTFLSCVAVYQRLLGHMDLDTREWFDGVLTAAARKVVKEPPEVRAMHTPLPRERRGGATVIQMD